MAWGASKRRRAEQEQATLQESLKRRRDQLVERLSRLEPMERLAALEADPRYKTFDHVDLLHDAANLHLHRVGAERRARLRADADRRASEGEAEREVEDARQRARDLRQRLRKEAGLPPEEEPGAPFRIPTPEERRAEDEARRIAYQARQAEQRAAWLEVVDREAAAQEAVRAAKAAEKEARRAAQAAKQGVMKEARQGLARTLGLVLAFAESAANSGHGLTIGQLFTERSRHTSEEPGSSNQNS